MSDNPFLPLSFIAGPAILTNASTVLLNGASIRYNLAIGLWRDLQSEMHGYDTAAASHYPDRPRALDLAHRRVACIVTALNLLYGAVGGFAASTLAGLLGALQFTTGSTVLIELAKTATVAAAGFGLICILCAVCTFMLESRCTLALLKLSMPTLQTSKLAAKSEEIG